MAVAAVPLLKIMHNLETCLENFLDDMIVISDQPQIFMDRTFTVSVLELVWDPKFIIINTQNLICKKSKQYKQQQ